MSQKVLDGYKTSMVAILTAERMEAVDIAIKYSTVDRQAESIPSLQFVTVKMLHQGHEEQW